jgi:hypothetical protein
MHEILSAEQPCVLCGGLLEVVTWHKDTDTSEERIERTRLDHNEHECLARLRLFKEELPCQYRF